MPGERRKRGFERAGWVGVRDLGLGGERTRDLELARAWRLAAGPVLAARAAVHVRRGVLEIEVPEAHWRKAMQPLAGEIAARVARESPSLRIERYRVRGAAEEPLATPEPVRPESAAPRSSTEPRDERPVAQDPSGETVEARLERLREAYLAASKGR